MLYSLPTLEHKAPRVEVDLAGANTWTLNCKVLGGFNGDLEKFMERINNINILGGFCLHNLHSQMYY